VDWSPVAGLYEIAFGRKSSEGGNVFGDDCKRAVYNQYMPLVMVSKEKRNAAGLMYDLLEYPEDSDKWYYALGGMKDATNHNLGYYVGHTQNSVGMQSINLLVNSISTIFAN
jgi:hypothetical protein